MRNTLTEMEFHESDAPVYEPQSDKENLYFKQSVGIANVIYQAAHENNHVHIDQKGQGELLGKWLYNEQQDKKEKRLKSTIELFMDSSLAPNASIGLHKHSDTEEIYYLLEGQLHIELIDKKGTIFQQVITAGDTHLIQPGESHFVKAGAQGARFIVVAAKVD
ncbi:hypothetical protein GCM10007916_17870 [Psychromonas marina]|uniref:Cupin type-2 domain-containing protein n=1 Tax=Psychromonas marina TaxID=88364 RepID=A0ABQ6E0K7_9GAMM|nr:cupin domain-containing protein [Psychromonas marina]GLS90720.1 hypothetical protein GCM10007916_17870 [Psychromonas marina]